MKRELKFFIDLFIDNCSGLSNPEIAKEITKLSSGSYVCKVGDNFAMAVTKSKDDSYNFNYVELSTKHSLASVKASIEEIKVSFKTLLMNR